MVENVQFWPKARVLLFAVIGPLYTTVTTVILREERQKSTISDFVYFRSTYSFSKLNNRQFVKQFCAFEHFRGEILVIFLLIILIQDFLEHFKNLLP